MAGQVAVLLGPTGSGKSSQAEVLVARGWRWLSSGELLRHAKSNDPDVASAMAKGDLVDSSKVEQIINSNLIPITKDTPIVFDGFPRELGEARWLDAELKLIGRQISHVFLLEASLTTISKRLASRGRSDDTQAALVHKWESYNAATKPVIDYYDSLNLLQRITENVTIDEAALEIRRCLDL